MLKKYGYAGNYHDEDISVGILLENPLDIGLEADTLVFSVTLRGKSNTVNAPRLEDFNFYLMDEDNNLYNAPITLYTDLTAAAVSSNDEPPRRPDGLIKVGFKHEFLFQDLRIVFYYRPYARLNVIKMKH
jgi:hypothetical protein